jgi:hypothetical protein
MNKPKIVCLCGFGPRLGEHEAIESLIKDGLRTLAS